MSDYLSRLNNDKLSNVAGGLSGNFVRDDSSKVFQLDDKELDMLVKEGYVDESGCILKKNLEKAQNFLQQSGWNGILYVKGKDFGELPEIIDLFGQNN